ncbi:hypothetical protein D3C85_969400 [compost metagenome]
MGFLQRSVVRDRHDDGVETVERIDVACRIARIHCHAHCGQDIIELGRAQRRDARRGFLYREAFQRCPHRIDFLHIPARDCSHMRADARQDRHEAFAFQLDERFPHGRAAHIELFGDLHLRQPAARRQYPLHDCLTQRRHDQSFTQRVAEPRRRPQTLVILARNGFQRQRLPFGSRCRH